MTNYNDCKGEFWWEIILTVKCDEELGWRNSIECKVTFGEK